MFYLAYVMTHFEKVKTKWRLETKQISLLSSILLTQYLSPHLRHSVF